MPGKKNGDNVNVVDIAQRRGANIDPTLRLSEPYSSLFAVTSQILSSHVGEVFDTADDALFALAEKAENSRIQNLYFDGMREVRLQRKSAEQEFRHNFARTVLEFAERRMLKVELEVSQKPQGELTLVDEHSLEESLALSAGAARTSNRLSRSLYALNQRLSQLSGIKNLDDNAHPFSPAALARVFQFSITDIKIDLEIKLILYKLFDRHVQGKLELVIDAVNNKLIQTGVLSNLGHGGIDRHAHQRRGSGQVTGEKQSQDTQSSAVIEASANQAASSTPSFEASTLPPGFYNALRSMMANRHAHPIDAHLADAMSTNAAATVHTESAPNLNLAELLSSLNLLQSQTAASTQKAEFSQIGAEQLKQAIYRQAEQLGTQGKQANRADEDTIDLVGMLFEFVARDKNLHAEIQALLSRLQTPYLKAAFLDRHLFAQSSHPARKLLDALARAGVGWTAVGDIDGRLIGKIREVVETLLESFDDNFAIFDRLNNEFSEFVDRHQKRLDLTEKRANDAARGKERLLKSRERAQQAIQQKLDGIQLPDSISDLIKRHWYSYLSLVFLRQGEHCEDWKEGLQFIDDLANTLSSPVGSRDWQAVSDRSEQVESILRKGLAAVACPKDDIQALWSALEAMLAPIDAQSSNPQQAKIDAVHLFDKAAQNIHLPISAIEISATEPAEAELPLQEINEEFLKLASDLKIGSWLEFQSEVGSRERAKLSWISSISSRRLFVNQNGLKVAEKTLYALATELGSGKTTILTEAPIIDRALRAIFEKLKSSSTNLAK